MPDQTIRDVLVNCLKGSRGKWRAISIETNIPYFTMCNISQGKVINPGIDTIEPLLDYYGYRLVKND